MPSSRRPTTATHARKPSDSSPSRWNERSNRSVEHRYETTSTGRSVITGQYRVGTQADAAFVDLTTRLTNAESSLPAGAGVPAVQRLDVDDVPVVVLTLASRDPDDVRLRALAQQVADRVAPVSGVGAVTLYGGRAPVGRVDVVPERLAALGLTLGSIAYTLGRTDTSRDAGFTSDGQRREEIRVGAPFNTVADLSNAVLPAGANATVRLRDVATVHSGAASRTSYHDYATRGGDLQTAVSIAVAKRPGYNVTKVAAAAIAAAHAVLLPADVTLNVTRNDGTKAAAAVNGLFERLASVDGGFGEARFATSNIIAVNWNQVLMYPAGSNVGTTMFRPTIVLPDKSWSFGTALPEPLAKGSVVSFAPATLERLVDSPLDAGKNMRVFTLLDADGFTNELDAFADRPAELEASDETIRGLKNLIVEMDTLYGYRHWRNYHFLLTISDTLPGVGVEHGSSSDDGNDGSALTKDDGIADTAGLLAHEFNHSYNGKYRRPADLATPNFQDPEETDLLWIYEGMTQLYGDVIPARAGIWKPDYIRENFASSYATEDSESGRLTRSLFDISASAPFLYAASGSLSSQRRSAGDFYIEGELLWLDVDARLDALSSGEKSLDGFCKLFFGIKNTPPEVNPYTYEEFVRALDSYEHDDWNAYFQTRVYAATPHPPNPFEAMGWKLVYTAKSNNFAMARAKRLHRLDVRYSLGISGSTTGVVGDVLLGSAAANAGVAYKDAIVAVDEREFTPVVLDEEIQIAAKRPEPIRLLLKRDGVFRSVSVDYHGGLRYPHLERVATRPDRLTPFIAAHRKAS